MSSTTPIEVSPLAQLVWRRRYRADNENSLDATWRRIAKASAAAEAGGQSEWEARFHAVLADGSFVPSESILRGAGVGQGAGHNVGEGVGARRVLAHRCDFGVLESAPLDLTEALRRALAIVGSGSTVSCDLSALTSGTEAGGPLEFLQRVESAMAQRPPQRGSVLASLRCNHPDVGAFIAYARATTSRRRIGLAVQVDDAMLGRGSAEGAVASSVSSSQRTGPHDRDALWAQVLAAAHEGSMPRVLFRRSDWQAAKAQSAGHAPPYRAPLGGALNVTAFILDPFEPGARLDMERLETVVTCCVRLLDNLIDLEDINSSRESGNRDLALGITGLGDALIMLGHRYDAWTARGVAGDVMRAVCRAAYGASAALAQARGSRAGLLGEACGAHPFLAKLPQGLRTAVVASGLRHERLLAIDPSAAPGILAGHVSVGVSPVAALQARHLGGTRSSAQLHHSYAMELWRLTHPGTAPPAGFMTLDQIGGSAQIDMLATVQEWTDGSVMQAVSVASDTSPANLGALYERAHARGLAECTIYRRRDR